jgi:hypothetical protein
VRLTDNRVVAETDFEKSVLRDLLLQHLVRSVEDVFVGAKIGDPEETGIMPVQADWECGSLECEAWIQPCAGCAETNSRLGGSGDIHYLLAWRTAEDEGYWNTLDEIIQWNDPEEDTECGEDLHLEVVR